MNTVTLWTLTMLASMPYEGIEDAVIMEMSFRSTYQECVDIKVGWEKTYKIHRWSCIASGGSPPVWPLEKSDR